MSGAGLLARPVKRGRWFAPALVAALAVTLTFLTLPVVAIFVRSSPGDLVAALDDPGVLDALWLSLRTTLMALAIIVVVGTPAAYLLATRTFRGHALVARSSSCRSSCRRRWPASGCSPRSGRAASSAARSRTPASGSRWRPRASWSR